MKRIFYLTSSLLGSGILAVAALYVISYFLRQLNLTFHLNQPIIIFIIIVGTMAAFAVIGNTDKPEEYEVADDMNSYGLRSTIGGILSIIPLSIIIFFGILLAQIGLVALLFVFFCIIFHVDGAGQAFLFYCTHIGFVTIIQTMIAVIGLAVWNVLTSVFYTVTADL